MAFNSCMEIASKKSEAVYDQRQSISTTPPFYGHSHLDRHLSDCQFDQKLSQFEFPYGTESNRRSSAVGNLLAFEIDKRPPPFDLSSTNDVDRGFSSFDFPPTGLADQGHSLFDLPSTHKINEKPLHFDISPSKYGLKPAAVDQPTFDMSNDSDMFLTSEDSTYWNTTNETYGFVHSLPPSINQSGGFGRTASPRSSTWDANCFPNHHLSRVLRHDNFITIGDALSTIQDILQNVDPNTVITPDFLQNRFRERYCQLCKKNGETYDFYTSHVLKDKRGKIICPILRSYTCPKCGANGDEAHTIRHCPITRETERLLAMESALSPGNSRRH